MSGVGATPECLHGAAAIRLPLLHSPARNPSPPPVSPLAEGVRSIRRASPPSTPPVRSRRRVPGSGLPRAWAHPPDAMSLVRIASPIHLFEDKKRFKSNALFQNDYNHGPLSSKPETLPRASCDCPGVLHMRGAAAD